MLKNKHKFFASSSDVGTALLFAGLGATFSAHAAYTVLQNDNAYRPPIVAQANLRVAAPGTSPAATGPQSLTVPFFEGRSNFGPRGRKAMREAYAGAKSALRITITGRPDTNNETNTALATQRANAIKAWLVASGIAADKFVVQTSTDALPDALPKVFDCEIRMDYNTPPQIVVPAQQPPAVVAPSRLGPSPAPSVDTVLTLVQQNKLSTDEAVDLLIAGATADLKKSQTVQPAGNGTALPITVSMRQASDTLTTPTSMPAANASHLWKLVSGQTLRTIITNWSAAAGWNKPDWQLDDPYYNETNYVFKGSIVDALTQLNNYVPTLDFDISIKKKQIIVTEHH